MIPEWLPPQLSLRSPSLQGDIDQLYAIYERDFIAAAASIVDGSFVYVNTHPDLTWNKVYPGGFTHMITRGKNMRSIDYDRARKLPWVKAVLENYTEPEVSAFWDTHPKGDTLYLWLSDYDFVVILRPKNVNRMSAGQRQIIVTAYHVDSWRKYDLQKRQGRSFRQL